MCGMCGEGGGRDRERQGGGGKEEKQKQKEGPSERVGAKKKKGVNHGSKGGTKSNRRKRGANKSECLEKAVGDFR